MLTEYPIPSATNIVCLTETELMALQFPSVTKNKTYKFVLRKGEELKPCPRLGKDYFITNQGRVMRKKQKPNGRVIETELKGSWHNGQKKICVTNPQKVVGQVARLMLDAFKPPVLALGRSVFGHLFYPVALDGNTRNLNLDNWTWMSKADANQYRKDTGENKPMLHVKEVQGRNKKFIRRVIYSDFEISEIERLLDAGIANKKVAEIFDCAPAYVGTIKKKLQKRNAEE